MNNNENIDNTYNFDENNNNNFDVKLQNSSNNIISYNLEKESEKNEFDYKSVETLSKEKINNEHEFFKNENEENINSEN